jgi:hypothetical protein
MDAMFDKKVKMLLLVINKMGIEMNYEVITRYSKKFDSMTSEYHLKKWNKREVLDEKTGDMIEKYYCVDKKFNRMDQVVKYLMAIRESNSRGVAYEKDKDTV